MNRYKVHYLGIGVLVGITLLSGYVHGRLSNRWGPPADMLAAAKRFEKLPKQFGQWRMNSSSKMTEHVVTMLECAGYINGSFINDHTGEQVNAFIILGPPGPVSVHTPEVCYSSRHYDIEGKRARVKIGEGKGLDEFWALTLKSTDVNKDMLRVYYAWSDSEHWNAPESPRFTYGGSGMLFKIQLAAYLPPETDIATADTCRRFLEAWLPVVNPILLGE